MKTNKELLLITNYSIMLVYAFLFLVQYILRLDSADILFICMYLSFSISGAVYMYREFTEGDKNAN